MAALKGIDLEKDDKSKVSKFEEIKNRVEAIKNGQSQEEKEFSDLGIDFKLEE